MNKLRTMVGAGLAVLLVGPLLVPSDHAAAVAGGYGTVNLARGKPVTPFSNTVAGAPANIVDGSIDTYWFSYQGSPSWNEFALDLGSSYSIGKIDLFLLQVHNFTLSTSDDNVIWTQRYASPWAQASISTPVSLAADGAYSARYIRYRGDANWFQYVGLIEIEVYEWLSSPPPPPPGSIGSTNLAPGKPVVSIESAATPPQYAVDGSLATVWQGNNLWRDDFWGKWSAFDNIRIDLGAVYPIGKIAVAAASVHSYYIYMAETDPRPAGPAPWWFASYPGMFGTNTTASETRTFLVNGTVNARYIWLRQGTWEAPVLTLPAIAEIEVYGWATGTPEPTVTPTSTATPEPTATATSTPGGCTTLAGLAARIDAFRSSGDIGNDGLTQSLLSKVNAAQAASIRGNLNAERGELRALINQVSAQSGKGISAGAAAQLRADVECLLASL